MNPNTTLLLTFPLFAIFATASAQESNGLAPEVVDLSAADVSYALEAKLPDLEEPFIDTAPADLDDGIPVGERGADGGDQAAVLAFANTNKQGTSYGFFWWRHDMETGKRKIDCISGRGAGGQFILILPELELIAVVTAHNKGMGTTLATAGIKSLARRGRGV